MSRANHPIVVQRLLLLAGLVIVLVMGYALTGERRLRIMMWNTVWLAGMVSAIAVPIGTVIALVTSRIRFPGRSAVVLAWTLGIFMPLYVYASAWEAGFGSLGWATLWQAQLQRPWLDGWTGAVWIHAVAAIPWAFVIMGITFHRTGSSLEEAALLDASPWQVFFRVSLRRALPGIALSTIWIAGLVASEITVTDMKQIRTFAEETYVSFVLGEEPLQTWWVILLNGSLLALAIAAVLLAVDQLAPQKFHESQRPVTWPMAGATRAWLVYSVIAFTVLMMGVPLANLIVKVGTVVTVVDGERVKWWSPMHAFSQCASVLTEFSREYYWSTLLGLGTAVTAIVASTGLVLASTRRWLAPLVVLLLGTCLATPGPVIGQVTVMVLNNPAIPPLVWLYDETLMAPICTLTVRCLPLTTLILWFAWNSVPRSTMDSARLHVGTTWQLFLRVVLPQRRGYWALALLVAFSLSWSEVGAINHMVVPPDVWLVSQRIFDLIHYGIEDRLAGFTLVTLTMFAALGIGTIKLGRSLLAGHAQKLE